MAGVNFARPSPPLNSAAPSSDGSGHRGFIALLFPEESWLAFCLMASMFLVTVWTVEGSKWVREMPGLTGLALGALFTGYVLSRIKVPAVLLHPVAGLRRVDTLEIGEPVYAIGNPLRFERTLSDGLISGKRRFGEVRMLQTSAPISPGSSGGGLFDSRGNLVGITTSSLKSAQSINFAIPAEDYWP